MFFRFSDLTIDNLTEKKLSPAYEAYTPILAYNQSKLCNILLCKELQKQWKNLKVQFYAVHPGNVIYTGLVRNWWFWRLLFTLVRPFAKSQVCTI